MIVQDVSPMGQGRDVTIAAGLGARRLSYKVKGATAAGESISDRSSHWWLWEVGSR